MLKLGVTSPEGKRQIVCALSPVNVVRVCLSHPVVVPGEPFGIPNTEIVIVAGSAADSLVGLAARQLREQGLDEETVAKAIAEAGFSHVLVALAQPDSEHKPVPEMAN